ANCDSGTLAWASGTGSSTAGPSGAGAAGFLHETDSWTFTCTRALTDPGTYHNTASADGCTDGSVQGCNQGSHATSGASNDVVVTVSAEVAPTATAEVSPTATASGGGGNVTAAPTDAIGTTGTSGPGDSAWLLIVALGVLLGSLVVLRPSTGKRHS